MGELKFEPPVKNLISHPYHEKRGDNGRHHGVDYASPIDTPVKASEGGVVRRASPNHGGYGEVVVIDHTPNAKKNERHIYTLYAHLQEYAPKIKPKKNVEKGDPLGKSGNTGTKEWNFMRERGYYRDARRGYHLHFEVLESPHELPWQETGRMGIPPGEHRVDPVSFFGPITRVEGAADDISDEEMKKLLKKASVDFELRHRPTVHVRIPGGYKFRPSDGLSGKDIPRLNLTFRNEAGKIFHELLPFDFMVNGEKVGFWNGKETVYNFKLRR